MRSVNSSTSSLNVLLTRSLTADDIGAWSRGPKAQREQAGELKVATLHGSGYAQSKPPPPPPVVLRPDVAVRAGRSRYARLGNRPSSAAIERQVSERLLEGLEHVTSTKPVRPQTAAAAMRPGITASHIEATSADGESAVAGRLARNLHFECVQQRVPLASQLALIVQLLEALPLLEGVPAAALHALAQRAELRAGERYHKLYSAGSEQTAGGYAFVLLSGEAEAFEEGGRARDESYETRVDRYAQGGVCGAELLVAPACVRPADPTVPRTQTCLWKIAGHALALPLAQLSKVRLVPRAVRELHASICAHLLLPLLKDGKEREPPAWAELKMLAAKATLTRRRAGEQLYAAGQFPDDIYILVRGVLELTEPPPRRADGGPSLDGRRNSLKNTLRRNSLVGGVTRRRAHPGPLDANLVLSEVVYEQYARVGASDGETSALVIAIPAPHARAVLNRLPALRAAVMHNSAAAKLRMTKVEARTTNHSMLTMLPAASSAPSATAALADTSASASEVTTWQPRPASPTGAYLASWHRSRAADLTRNALFNVPHGVRTSASAANDPPWTFLIAQVEGLQEKQKRKTPSPALGPGLSISVSMPIL